MVPLHLLSIYIQFWNRVWERLSDLPNTNLCFPKNTVSGRAKHLNHGNLDPVLMPLSATLYLTQVPCPTPHIHNQAHLKQQESPKEMLQHSQCLVTS